MVTEFSSLWALPIHMLAGDRRRSLAPVSSSMRYMYAGLRPGTDEYCWQGLRSVNSQIQLVTTFPTCIAAIWEVSSCYQFDLTSSKHSVSIGFPLKLSSLRETHLSLLVWPSFTWAHRVRFCRQVLIYTLLPFREKKNDRLILADIELLLITWHWDT